MKTLLALLTLFFMSFASTNTYAEMPKLDERAPSVVLFYADWCGSCKILDPKLKEATKDMDGFDMVVLDMTDDETKAKSSDLAAQKGLTDVYQAYAPKTGMAILVDANGAEVATLKKNKSIDEIKAAIQSMIATQS